jgi:hypothetical protein
LFLLITNLSKKSCLCGKLQSVRRLLRATLSIRSRLVLLLVASNKNLTLKTFPVYSGLRKSFLDPCAMETFYCHAVGSGGADVVQATHKGGIVQQPNTV